ncbi:Cas9 inhibitor AcrIIA9 family protein [Flavobacterium sp.]|uniref:PcfK-like family protein n=1 Tax=Flavobacterium sp. TaxID=239 RepID=UPI002638C256|nr:Cas9 inhibitor AcrIIA9 family protein [Flavobacterium sp.]
METQKDPFKEAILKHLEELAQKDELFANTLAKPHKNIDDCATYIFNEVKKTRRQGFADEEIYNMAIHYYDEDSIEIGKPISAKVVVNHALAAPVQKSFEPAKSTTKKINTNQTTLF